MTAPLTILHLTHDGRGAGSNISIALLARAQLAAGHRVLVAGPADSWLARRITAEGTRYLPASFDSRHGGDPGEGLERIISSERIGVVNAHSSRARSVTRWMRLRGRLRAALVMTRRAMPMSTPVSALWSGFAADRTIAVSRPVARALVRRGTPPWRVTVVHNAVDLGRLDVVVTERERDGALSLIRGTGARGHGGTEQTGWLTPLGPMVGVVSRPKDHDTLIEAMHHVRDALLVSLGFAASFPSAGAPVPRCPVFLPFQDNPRPFYDLFDVVALPTRHEGLSQGLMEAMALGKAIVTTRSGGNTDLIEDGVHGLMVAPGDPAAMGAAIQRLLDDGALRERLGAAARERVRREFTIEQTAAGTEAAYRVALERR